MLYLIRIAALLVLSVATFSGCGKKPDHVEAKQQPAERGGDCRNGQCQRKSPGSKFYFNAK